MQKFELLEQIGIGGCSKLYKDGNVVYKILKEEAKRAYSRFYNKSALKKLAKLDSDLCTYPKEILENEQGELIGYSMDYVPGDKLKNIIKKLPFEQLQEAIKEAENKITEESKSSIIFNDMHEDNIMWNTDKQSIQIIDTEFFIQDKDISTESITNSNSFKFADTIISMLSPCFYNYITNNDEMAKFKEEFSSRFRENKFASANEYISKLRSVLEKEFETTFNNIDEMQEVLRIREEEIEEQEYEGRMREEMGNNMAIKQKIAKKLGQSSFFRRLPFINKFIEGQLKMLPEALKQNISENTSKGSKRKKFADKISGNGQHRGISVIESIETHTQNSNIKSQSSMQSFTEEQK